MALKYKLILSDTDLDHDGAGVIADGYCFNGADLAKITTNAAAMLAISRDIAMDALKPRGGDDAESE